MVDDCAGSIQHQITAGLVLSPISPHTIINRLKIVDDFRLGFETRGNCWQAHTDCGAMGRAAGWLSLALSHVHRVSIGPNPTFKRKPQAFSPEIHSPYEVSANLSIQQYRVLP